MTKARAVLGCVMLVIVASACETDSGASAPATLDTAVERMVVISAQSGVTPACGRPPASHSIKAIVAASAESCLSCKNLGGIIRQYMRTTGLQQEQLMLITPVADTSVVCEYLHHERLPIPVIARTDNALWIPLLQKNALFVIPGVNRTEYQMITRQTARIEAPFEILYTRRQ